MDEIEASYPTQEEAVIVQLETAQFIQLKAEQKPKILELTTLTNHIEKWLDKTHEAVYS